MCPPQYRETSEILHGGGRLSSFIPLFFLIRGLLFFHRCQLTHVFNAFPLASHTRAVPGVCVELDRPVSRRDPANLSLVMMMMMMDSFISDFYVLSNSLLFVFFGRTPLKY